MDKVIEIKINDGISLWDSIEEQLRSGVVKIEKKGETIADYLICDVKGNLCLPPTYMGYEVKDITEDEENIIVKVGKKVYDWKPSSFNFNLKMEGLNE